jgi:hypothetical protein
MNRVKSANGVTGILLFGNLQPVFRVYDPDNKSKFIDYEIAHTDLQVTIKDDDATFYEHAGQDINFLDHSPLTLGYSKQKGEK